MDATIDVSLVKRAANNNSKKMIDLLTIYIDSLNGDISVLKECSKKKEILPCKKVVHRISGAAKMIGAHGLVNACESVRDAEVKNIDQLIVVVFDTAIQVGLRVQQAVAELDSPVEPQN